LHAEREGPESMVEPPPDWMLRDLVASIPGPPNESEAGRAARFAAQMAEIRAMNPRDSVDAMLAVQCVMMRLLADDSRRDAERPRIDPIAKKKFLNAARKLDEVHAELKRALTSRQARAGWAPPVAPPLYPAGVWRAPWARDATDPPDEAESAVIVPLHPSPKMLQ
jgi:hypothetical protein